MACTGENNKLALELSDIVNDNYVEYVYRGAFNTKITESILAFAEANAESSVDNVKVKKRFYFILVEGLQNITRHQDVPDDSEAPPGLLVIQRIGETYIITTGNYIKNENIPLLTDKLKRINSLSDKELREYYRQVLTNKTFSEKGGAGLGLIEIARKSKNKLFFDFEKINEEFSFFFLQTTINLEDKKIESSLDKIKLLYKIIEKNGIVLTFSGIFSHEKLLNLLSIIEGSKQLSIVKNKMYGIIIEMLQNIAKHADNYIFNEQKGKYAIFFIRESEEFLKLTAGNYIKNEKVHRLSDFLDMVNSLNNKELSKLHFQTPLKYKHNKELKHGLGLIDMRIKSRHPFEYIFQKVDDNFSFFSLTITISKHVSHFKTLTLEESASTPQVILSDREGKFVFCGNSFPQNSEEFYKPIIEWLKKYSENPRPFTIFEFKFRLTNTPTQQQLIQIMNIIEEIAESSAVVVKWYYEGNNEDNLMFGVEFSQLFNIQFDLIEVDEIICLK